MGPVFDVRVLTVDDVPLYRAIRLRALSSDPRAFGSTFERESAFDDETWRSRLRGIEGRPGVVHLAVSASGDSIGTAGIGFTPDDTAATYLWGMWVAPEGRRTGASRTLVAACIDWAREANATEVRLDVKRDNAPAIALYERIGFVHAGAVPGEDACAGECRMVLSL
jgi:RimJ/RimL family protein N-acetyltransferase